VNRFFIALHIGFVVWIDPGIPQRDPVICAAEGAIVDALPEPIASLENRDAEASRSQISRRHEPGNAAADDDYRLFELHVALLTLRRLGDALLPRFYADLRIGASNSQN
jgi:hypothetical protein